MDDVELWTEPEGKTYTATEVHGGRLMQPIGFLAVHVEPKPARKKAPKRSPKRRPDRLR